jgi:hemerythrin-like domain-containing protein
VKRSEELTPLSRDHHQALFVALQLRRAEDLEGAREAFLPFWEEKGAEHFRIEEEVLLPGWIDRCPDAAREPAGRLCAEHLEIRVAARRLAAGALSLEQARALGERLDEHVRFEERELFPRIEADLTAELLAELGEELDAAEGDAHG